MRLVDVVIPKMGMTTEEVDVTRWLVAAGDRVVVGKALAEVESEKTVVTVEAEAAGTVAEILVEAGSPAKVGDVICRIRVE